MMDIRNSLFGRLAIQTGLVTQAQIEECLLIQEAAKEQGKKIPRLGELLAHKGILTPEQVKTLLRQQFADQPAAAKPATGATPPVRSTAKATPSPTTIAGRPSTLAQTTTGSFSETTLFDSKEEDVVAEFGRFRLLERLGSDADGMTFKAKTPDSEEPVILRTIAPKLSRDPDFVRRFTDQSKKASQLKHPAIARVLSAGKVDLQYYYTAEFVEGKSLRRFMNRFGAMEPRQVLDIAIGIAEALEAGHARGIFHQHLRPNYILLKEDGTVSVSGFGILPDPIRELRQLVSTIGETPFYIAPEQAAGSGGADARTDIYSLGAIVYHALCGQPPFCGDSVEEVLLHIAEDDVPAISIINPDVPPALEDVVHAMVAPNPEDRPQNATRLIEQLKSARDEIEGKKASAPSKTTTRRLNHINRTAKASDAVQEKNVVAVKRMGISEKSLKRSRSEKAKRYQRGDKPNLALYGIISFLGLVGAIIIGFIIYEGMQKDERDRQLRDEQARRLEMVTVRVTDPATGTVIDKQMTRIEFEAQQRMEEERKRAEITRKKAEEEKKTKEKLEKEKALIEQRKKELEERERRSAVRREAFSDTPGVVDPVPPGAADSASSGSVPPRENRNSLLPKSLEDANPMERDRLNILRETVYDRTPD